LESPSARAISGIVRLVPGPRRPSWSRQRIPYSSWALIFTVL